MTVSARKITAFAKLVAGLADTPNLGSTALLKQWFDSSPEELRVAFNGLIDDLLSAVSGSSGAENIGSAAISGVAGATAYAQLVDLKAQIQAAIVGQIPDNTLDYTKLKTSAYSSLANSNTLAFHDVNGNTLFTLPTTKGMNPNLLFNPSGRMGLTGWTVTNGGGSAWQALFGTITDGGYFACGSVTAGSPLIQSTSMPAGVGQVVNLSLEMYSVGVTVGQQVCDIVFMDNANTNLGTMPIVATNGQGWTKYTVSGTTPANTTKIVVRCYGQSFTTTNSGWRKIKVETGSVATTFSDDNTLNTLQYGSVLPLLQALSGGNKVETGTGSGVVTSPGVGISVPITFPTAFSVAPIVYLIPTSLSVGDAGYINVRSGGSTTTTGTVLINSYVAQTIGFNWIAIGS